VPNFAQLRKVAALWKLKYGCTTSSVMDFLGQGGMGALSGYLSVAARRHREAELQDAMMSSLQPEGAVISIFCLKFEILCGVWVLCAGDDFEEARSMLGPMVDLGSSSDACVCLCFVCFVLIEIGGQWE